MNKYIYIFMKILIYIMKIHINMIINTYIFMNN